LEAVLVCLRVAAGVSLVFLVPGLPWSYALLARHRRSLLETLGVGVALSIALVPLGLFLLNLLLGIPVGVPTILVLCGRASASQSVCADRFRSRARAAA
jgi:uncharacterized membrane protein